MKTIVCNSLGGPGSGKSTMAFGLMALLKSRGHKAEFVPEFAKDLTYRQDWATLANQDLVTREQDRRIRDLVGHVDYVVSDSSIAMGIIYASGRFAEGDWFKNRVWQLHDSYINFTVFVNRCKPYQEYGRTQSEDEAKKKDKEILDLFGHDRIDLFVDGVEGVEEKVYAKLLEFREKIGVAQW